MLAEGVKNCVGTFYSLVELGQGLRISLSLLQVSAYETKDVKSHAHAASLTKQSLTHKGVQS